MNSFMNFQRALIACHSILLCIWYISLTILFIPNIITAVIFGLATVLTFVNFYALCNSGTLWNTRLKYINLAVLVMHMLTSSISWPLVLIWFTENRKGMEGLLFFLLACIDPGAFFFCRIPLTILAWQYGKPEETVEVHTIV
jgi:hypothetical protein